MWNKLNNSTPKELSEIRPMTATEFQEQLDKVGYLAKDICFHCGGSGNLNAMQNMAIIGGDSVRGPDTKVKCNHCKGSGRK